MRPSPIQPKIHLFVCTNQREPGDALGEGCGERGRRVFVALKDRVAAERAYAAVWISQTACMGVCPRKGATVAVYGSDADARTVGLHTEVEPKDAGNLYDEVTRPTRS